MYKDTEMLFEIDVVIDFDLAIQKCSGHMRHISVISHYMLTTSQWGVLLLPVPPTKGSLLICAAQKNGLFHRDFPSTHENLV